MNTFEITIRPRYEDDWRVECKYTKSGNSPTYVEGKFQIDEGKAKSLAIEPSKFKNYGTLLGKALFCGVVRDRFIEAVSSSDVQDRLRVLLYIQDKELATWRWAKLCGPTDNGDFDFLRFNKRVTFSINVRSPINSYLFPPISNRDLRGLILVTGPKKEGERLDWFDVEKTVKSVQEALKPIDCTVLANLEGYDEPTLSNLVDKLQNAPRYTFLHIVCHGKLSNNKDEQDTILYWFNASGKYDTVKGKDLIDELTKKVQNTLPNFTFLCACESAGSDEGEALGGLAGKLVRDLGMPAVVAMTEKVEVQTAQDIAAQFYKNLLDLDGQVDLALAKAIPSDKSFSDILIPALFSRLEGFPLFSISNRIENNKDIEFGLNRLLEINEQPENWMPGNSEDSKGEYVSLIKKYAPILEAECKSEAEKLRDILRSGQNLGEGNTKSVQEQNLQYFRNLCEEVFYTENQRFTFDALALNQPLPEYDARCPFQGLLSFTINSKEFFKGREKLIEDLKKSLNKDNFLMVFGESGSGKSSVVMAGLIPSLLSDDESKQVAYLTPSQHPLTQLEKSLEKNSHPPIIVFDQFEELFTICDKTERKEFIKRLLKLVDQNQKIVITMRVDFWGECANYGKKFRELVEKSKFFIWQMNAIELQRAMEQQADAAHLRFEAGLSHSILKDVEGEPGAMPLLQHALRELWKRRHGQWLLRAEYENIGTEENRGLKGAIAKTADDFYDKLSQKEQEFVRDIFVRLTHLDENAVEGENRRDTRKRVELEALKSKKSDAKVIEKLVIRLTNERLVITSLNNATNKQEVEVAHEALIQYWTKLRRWLDEDRGSLLLRQRIEKEAKDWDSAGKKEELLLLRGNRLQEAGEFLSGKGRFRLNKLEKGWDYVVACQKLQERERAERENRDEALRTQITTLTALSETALSEARFQDSQLEALIHILQAGRIVQQFRDSKPPWIREDTFLRTKVVLRQILAKVKEFNRFEDNNIPFGPIKTLAFTTSNELVIIEQGRPLNLNSVSPQEMILMEDIHRVPDDNSQNITSRSLIRLWQVNGSLETSELLESPLIKWNPVSRMFAHFIYRSSQPQEKPKPNAIRLLSLEGEEVILQEDERDTLATFAFSPNGQLIASGGFYGQLYLWYKDGTTIKNEQIGGYSMNAIDFSPNSEMFATGSNDGAIRLWNQNGEKFKTIEAHRDAPIWGVSFSPDGETLASVSTDTTVKIWKTDGTLLTTLNGHRAIVRAVCFNSNGEILASASDDGTVRLWKPNGTAFKGLYDPHRGAVYTVRFSPDNQMIATTSGVGQLILWRRDGQLLKTWYLGEGHHGTITALDFSPNGRMLVTAAGDRQVKLWRLDDIDKQDFRPHTFGNHTGELHLSTGFAVSFSSDNQTFLLGCGDQNGHGTLELCDSEHMSCKIIQEYQCQVLAVCFSPDAQMFALGKGDGSVELWRKEEDDFKFIRSFKQHDHIVNVVCFSPDGKLLATGSYNTTVKLWQIDNILNNGSTTTLTPINIPAPTEGVTAVRFSPNGDLLATASYDKTVKLWNLDGTFKTTLYGHNDRVNALDFSPDGKILASASNDKTAILWNLDLEQESRLDQLIDHGCNWISGYLTNNPNVSESDRKVLSRKEFPLLKY